MLPFTELLRSLLTHFVVWSVIKDPTSINEITFYEIWLQIETFLEYTPS